MLYTRKVAGNSRKVAENGRKVGLGLGLGFNT
jgi:hypothetical protein